MRYYLSAFGKVAGIAVLLDGLALPKAVGSTRDIVIRASIMDVAFIAVGMLMAMALRGDPA